MDRNERLLRRVVEERSGTARIVGIPAQWVLPTVVVGIVAAAAAGFILVRLGSPSVLQQATHDVVLETSTPKPTQRTAESTTTSAPGSTASDLSTIVPNAMSVPATGGVELYVTQPGDSVASVAARTGLRPATIISLNELDHPELLQPGRELIVPPTDGVLHVVESGETLRDIAERYGVGVAALVSVNDIADPDHIRVGLHLFIPDAGSSSSGGTNAER
jgi:LysM repeat protein